GPGGTDGDPETAPEGALDAGDAAAGCAEGFALPDSSAARMSFLLMRPPAPLPSSPARSKLCSLAMRRTSGELRIFSPLPGAVGAALGASGVGGTAACAAGATGVAAGAGCAAGLGPSFLSGAAAGTGGGEGTVAGAAAGTVAGAAADAPSASITATTVWMGTVC